MAIKRCSDDFSLDDETMGNKCYHREVTSFQCEQNEEYYSYCLFILSFQNTELFGFS